VRSVLQDRVAPHHPRGDPPGVARQAACASAGGRAVFLQRHHAQSVQTCRSGKTAPHYRQRVGG
jgi:putative hemolysin